MFRKPTSLLQDGLTSLFKRNDTSVVPEDKPRMVPAKMPPLQDYLIIPTPTENPEDIERTRHHERGQFLARQDMWAELADEIQTADQARQATSGGMPVAELLAYGAREDVVLAAEHALFDGTPTNKSPVLDGIDGLEEILVEFPDSYPIALIVALAHVDIGWAWRGTGWASELPTQNREVFEAHFDRASSILDGFDGVTLNAPALAAARCALLAGTDTARARIADDYEDLIDLNPANARPMRAMGNHLLPRWFGDYQTLELEARRTASRTQDVWGNGAYAWVYFDAMVVDENACAQIDLPFFIDGLHDILKVSNTQHTANLLAAHCTVAMREGSGSNDAAEMVRLHLKDCANWIIREHLTELHPLVWAHASQGFDNAARVSSLMRFAAMGRADALRVIAEMFRDDLVRGNRVVFGPDGLEVLAAS